jgi:hypothetical protein
MKKTNALAALALAALAFVPAARAEDSLKIAIGQINNWENQAPTLGQDAGIRCASSCRRSRAPVISTGT